MLRPSKLFQRTMLASAKACVSTPGAAPARVQAVAARPAASSVSTVLGPLAPSIATAISPLAGCRPIARTLPPRARVEQAQLLAAVDVDARGQQLAVLGHRELVDVPGDVRRQRLQRLAPQLVAVDLAEFAAAIAEHPQRAVAALEAGGEVDALVLAARRGQQLRAAAAGEVEQPHLRFVGREVARQHRLAVVRGDAAHVPAGAGQLGDAALARRLGGVDQSEGLARLLACAALRAAVQRHRAGQQLAAAVQPGLEAVAPRRVGQQRDVARGEVEAVELVGLVAAVAAREDEVVTAARLPGGAAHRLGGIGERLGFGQRRGDAEQLQRARAGLAMAYQQLAPLRMPLDQVVAAEIGIARHFGHQRGGDGRNALRDQVGVGCDDGRWLGRGRAAWRIGIGAGCGAGREEQRQEQGEAKHRRRGVERGRKRERRIRPVRARRPPAACRSRRAPGRRARARRPPRRS